ncbi:hypothetical protein [Rhizobium sp. SL42]|uniref:hypothetical protein n=1 Tax=Rhizobium sp. SL42 TaxID=2806346 RepID=UPI001F17D896|nr:hypothetical protein [Rhizobium sp. SL42]UJW76995.1 hypothetical protein IM739_21120 [Rhizobium sp. SL42]
MSKRGVQMRLPVGGKARQAVSIRPDILGHSILPTSVDCQPSSKMFLKSDASFPPSLGQSANRDDLGIPQFFQPALSVTIVG